MAHDQCICTVSSPVESMSSMPGRVFVFEDYFHEDRALIFLVVFFSNLVGMVWGTELMREQTDLGVRDLTMTWTSWINTVYLSGSLGLTQAFLQLPGVLQTWFSMKQSNYKQGILTDNNIFKKEKEKKTESGRKAESSFSNRNICCFQTHGAVDAGTSLVLLSVTQYLSSVLSILPVASSFRTVP